MYDIGVVTTKEPFQTLVNQGIILGEVEYTAYKLNGSWVPADAADSPGVEEVKVSKDDVVKKGNGYVLKSDQSIQVILCLHNSKDQCMKEPKAVLESYSRRYIGNIELHFLYFKPKPCFSPQ